MSWAGLAACCFRESITSPFVLRSYQVSILTVIMGVLFCWRYIWTDFVSRYWKPNQLHLAHLLLPDLVVRVRDEILPHLRSWQWRQYCGNGEGDENGDNNVTMVEMPMMLSTPPQWEHRQCGRGPRQGEQKQGSLRAGPQQGAGNFKFWILWLVIFHEIHHFIFRCWHFQLLWSDVTKPPFDLEIAFNVIPSWYHQRPGPAVPPYPTSPILISKESLNCRIL